MLQWLKATVLVFLLPFMTHGGAQDEDLYEIDLRLGLQRHQGIASQWSFVTMGSVLGQYIEVASRVASARLWNAATPASFFLVSDEEVNAFAAGGGRVYVTIGMMRALNGSPGMLAFVVGHEMAHNALQHGARRYLREVRFQRQFQYNQSRCRKGENEYCVANGALAIAYATLEKKLERNEEHEADRLGMLAAAEAGYHPDYAILVARRLKSVTREQSKFAAFFSSHPRWTTREERAERHYAEALERFYRSWPDAAASPGGAPPPYGSVSDPVIVKERGQTLVSAEATLRNTTGLQMQAMLILRVKDSPADIVVQRIPLDSLTAGKAPITLEVPPGFLKGRKGKIEGSVAIVAGEEVVAKSKTVKVR